MITVRDVLEAITGESSRPQAMTDTWAVRRPDGSWLFDGLIPVPELKDRLWASAELPEEDRGRYNTLAGMVMLLLGRLPRTADTVDWADWRFEVVDPTASASTRCSQSLLPPAADDRDGDGAQPR